VARCSHGTDSGIGTTIAGSMSLQWRSRSVLCDDTDQITSARSAMLNWSMPRMACTREEPLSSSGGVTLWKCTTRVAFGCDSSSSSNNAYWMPKWNTTRSAPANQASLCRLQPWGTVRWDGPGKSVCWENTTTS
jgi:hypothetical protein